MKVTQKEQNKLKGGKIDMEEITTLEKMWFDLELLKFKEKNEAKQDKLDKIFNHQKQLQQKLGIYNKIANDPKMLQQYINQMILALHEEATEIMRETAYKNPEYMPFGWKKGQEFNNENFKNELIDIIHFVMNLCIVSGMDPQEIFERYIGKNKENFKRQDDGY